MNAPEWTKDEQSIEAAKSYVRDTHTVDFFEMICRNILCHHPADLVEFCLGIVKDIMSGAEISSAADFQPKKMDDNKYMCDMGVCSFLDQWILALLRERPGHDLERMEFHKRYLEGLRSEPNTGK
ncbi:hypothetical protein, conserved [Leishmania tarentolae]|uniref:Antigen 2 n=1 Tax=Leishmania tarentolae TaxID=5689 RepID=A0A640KN43_LEITA|nr:hypothetical protein, conserved [Leishmania tarentolae]